MAHECYHLVSTISLSIQCRRIFYEEPPIGAVEEHRVPTANPARGVGLSQQEVAEKADLSLSLVAKMEQGRNADPRASTLIALSGALGVRPGQPIEDLTPPPEGTFPAKGKKKKKKKVPVPV